MPSSTAPSGPHRNRRARRTRPCVQELEPRVVLSISRVRQFLGSGGSRSTPPAIFS